MVSRGKVIATGYGNAVVLAITVDRGFLATCTVAVQETNAVQDTIVDCVDETFIYDMMGNKVQHVGNLVALRLGETVEGTKAKHRVSLGVALAVTVLLR